MTFPSSNNNDPTMSWIVYDGECPYCRNYVRLIRLRENLGNVRLIDARQKGPEVKIIYEQGYNLDEGMIFYHEGRFFFGGDAIHALALLSSSSSIFNKFNKWVFKSQKRSNALYPLLRSIRNLTLRILGKRKISGECF